MLLPAQFPVTQSEAVEFGILGELSGAVRLAESGDSQAVGARLFVVGRKGEMIEAPRHLDGQERARVKFGENGRARFVLAHAGLPVCRVVPGVPALRHVSSPSS